MIGRFSSDPAPVTIIGGGAAGLLLAYGLVKQGRQVIIYEATDRLGGMLATVAHPLGLVEAAANSLVATPALRTLCNDIGADLQDLAPDSHAKYIVRRQRLRRNPLGIAEMLRAGYGMLAVKAQDSAPSAAAFADHHLGPAALQFLIDPLIAGIYGATPQTINMAAALPNMTPRPGQTLWQKMREVRKLNGASKREVVVVRGGMQVLVTKLSDYLQRSGQCVVHLQTPPTTISKVMDNAKNIALTVPAPQAHLLLRERSPQAAEALARIRYTPMVSLGLFVKRSELARIPKGLGVLIPSAERRGVLGILFTSATFPDRVHSSDDILLTCMMGGETDAEALAKSDDELVATAKAVIGSLYGWKTTKPQISAVCHRWPRAIPMYDSALQENLAIIARSYCNVPGRVIFGNYTGEVSLRGMLTSCVQSLV